MLKEHHAHYMMAWDYPSLARGIAYSFLEAQGAVAIAGAITVAPELAVGGPAGVAVDASIAAIGSLMFFAGDAGRRQAADDLAEKGSHNKNSKDSDAKNSPKTLDDILEDAEPGRITKGKTIQYVKSGSYEQTSNDFDALNPVNVKEIDTKFDPARQELCLMVEHGINLTGENPE